jgi:hypothetical protein
MYKRKRFIGALGAVAAVAVLASAVSAASGSAEAATVACPASIVGPPKDAVRITLVNYDFGDGELVDNEPEGCGTLTWNLDDDTITPELDGTMFAKNAIGTRVRMRLRHRDVDGTLLATSTGASKLVETNDVEEFPIDLGNYSDPLIYRVDVELQQRINGVWETKGTEREYLGSASKAPDAVRSLAVGQDFGDGPFSSGAPADSGTLTWDLANDTRTPHLEGTLYVQNAAGTKVRMRMRHYDIHGDLLISASGGTKEASTNALTTFPIDLANYSNPEIYKVEVAMTVKVGQNWTVVGTPVTVTI